MRFASALRHTTPQSPYGTTKFVARMTVPSLSSLPSLSLARLVRILSLAVLVSPVSLGARPALAQTLKVEGIGEARAHEGTKEVVPTVKLGTAPHIIALASILNGDVGNVHLEASVTGSGYADYGRLGGEVVSQARSVAPFEHTFEPFARGFLRLGFTDTVTVVSSTLAPGTPVPVEFVSLLSSAIQVTQPNLFGGSLTNGAAIGYEVEVKDLSTSQTIRRFHANGMAGASPNPQILSFTSTVGAVFEIRGEMDLTASAFAPGRFGGGDVLATSAAKASNTGHLFFRPVTPGVALVSASGHDYDINAASTAAPEPTTLALVALVVTASGLTPVTGWARRRRRSGEDEPDVRDSHQHTRC